MNLEKIKYYFINCFALTIPVMVWDVVFTAKLPKPFQPAIFWNDIPDFLIYGENILRIIVFVLAFLMPLHISTTTQKRGLVLYITGIIFYFASWILLIYFPDSAWSNSLWGFAAPAYTPFLWLAGIGYISDSFYFNLPFRRWLFILVSLVFLIFHNLHVMIIYFRIV